MDSKELSQTASNARDTARRILRFFGEIELTVVRIATRAVFKHDAGFSLLSQNVLDEMHEYTAFAVVHALLMTVPPVLFGGFIDALAGKSSAGEAFGWFFGFALATAGGIVMNRMLEKRIRHVSREWELELQIRLLATFQSLAPGRSGRFPPGEAALKFFRDAVALGDYWRSFYPQLLRAVSLTAFSFLAVLNKSRIVAPMFLIIIPLMFLPNLRWRDTFRQLRQKLRNFNDSVLNRVFEAMHILPYLKSLAAEAPYSDDTRERLRSYNLLNCEHDRAEVGFETASQLALFAGQVTILAASGIMASKGKITGGDVVAFNTLFLSMLTSLHGIFRLLPNLENTRESLRSVEELLDAPEIEPDSSGATVVNAAGDIEAKNVFFSYPGGSREILRDFSCRIPGGSIVGVTGENGSGKTTLLKLLTGTLTPTFGSVTVDGVDLAQCRLAAFRRRIASVFQETLLITGTLRDNITIKDGRYTSADIRSALKLSGADALVARVPEGLDHRIGFNDGGGLSGGERQKLAIARALIRRPDILIFDEVTNHLDYESRLKMRDLLSRLRGKTTVLLVSHDPELIKLCDMEIRLSITGVDASC